MSTTEGTVAQVLAGDARWAVVCADNAEILRDLPDGCVDHVITDPPYDARTHASAVCGKTDGETGVAFSAIQGVGALAGELVRLSRRWALAFCAVEMIGDYAEGAGDAWVRAGVWDKINPTPQLTGDRPGQAVEAIAIMHRAGKKRWNRGGEAGIWRCQPPRGSDRPDHPTPKPIELMLALIADFTDPCDLILDQFAGSGTTGAAALRMGRRVILIEREERWANDCRERLRAEEQGTTTQAQRQGQVPLFGVGT